MPGAGEVIASLAKILCLPLNYDKLNKWTRARTPALGKKATSTGSVRENLIRKGMIYSPKYGEAAFTAPLFGAFMKRALATPSLKAPAL